MPRRRVQHRVGRRDRRADGGIRTGTRARRARAWRGGRVRDDAERAHRRHRDREHGARRRLSARDRTAPAAGDGDRAGVSAVRCVRRGRLDVGPVVEAVAHHYLDAMFSAASARRIPIRSCSAARTSRCSPMRSVRSSGTRPQSSIPLRRPRSRSSRRSPRRGLAAPAGSSGRLELLATDDAGRFARVGGIFLGRPLTAGDVEIVDLRDNAQAANPKRRRR